LTGSGAGATEEVKYSMRGVMVDIVMEDDAGADGKELCFSVRALPRCPSGAVLCQRAHAELTGSMPFSL
jgi:hypothetical protein